MFDVRRLFAAQRRPEPTIPYERGVAAFDDGRFEDALAAFDAALADANDAGAAAAAHNKRGVALVALRRRGDALEAFCAALISDERCAPALVNIGNLLLEDGHALDAIDYYESALRIDDAYPAAYGNLGVALRRLGRRPESVRALKRADRLLGSRRS
jgi:tetratricopeptide (TPR) repeat protein